MRYFKGPLFEITSTCKGGGYTYCRTEPPHPKQNSSGLYPLHRVLMENKLGRLLESNEVVHHRDEDRYNNKISNLEVKTRSDHSRDHAKFVDRIEVDCGLCGTRFLLRPDAYRRRLGRNTSGLLFCSRSCGARATYEQVNGRSGMEQLTCTVCGKQFELLASVARTRRTQKGADGLSCSRSCGQKSRRRKRRGVD